MTWQNAFDLGECTVTLSFGLGATKLWSGVLGKGDSSPSIDFSSAGYNMTGVVSVDADGVVSLSTSMAVGGSGWSAQINVVPSYAHDYPARISQANFNSVDQQGVVATINSANPQTEGVDYLGYGVGFDNALPAPDPIDMSALTGQRDLIGLWFKAVGY